VTTILVASENSHQEAISQGRSLCVVSHFQRPSSET